MKSQVNLYTAELRPVKQTLPLSLVLFGWGGLLLVMLSAYAVLSVLHNQQTAVNDRLTEQQNSQLTLVGSLTTELSAQIEDPQFVKKQQELQTELDLKQRLLRIYSNREDEKNQGFSGLLEGLAETSTSRLWLTRISLVGTKLSLEGVASGAAAIPAWVDGLKQSEYLAGRDFAALQISRDEQQQLNFTLLSDEPPPAVEPRPAAKPSLGVPDEALKAANLVLPQEGGP